MGDEIEACLPEVDRRVGPVAKARRDVQGRPLDKSGIWINQRQAKINA